MCDRTQPGTNNPLTSSTKCCPSNHLEIQVVLNTHHTISYLANKLLAPRKACISLCLCVGIMCMFVCVGASRSSLRCVGLSDRGVGEEPQGLWLQPARGDRVQHGSVHPETGWGWTCSAGRKDPCECFTCVPSLWISLKHWHKRSSRN